MTIQCSPVACPYSNVSVPLTGACTASLPGAVVAYTVAGRTTTSAVCPDPSATLVVNASVDGYLGACNYAGPTISLSCAYFAARR